MKSRTLRAYRSTALIVALLAPIISAAATPVTTSLRFDGSSDVDAAIREASLRFGVPASWVRGVIQLESRGTSNAVSAKGALGLMQLMPATYEALRQRLGLGADPLSVRNNVMAGTAYLRDMLDRYGVVGMLGAYNAGPGRWEQHLAGSRTLPAETVGYITALGPLLTSDLVADTVAAIEEPPRTPAEASLFVPANAPQPPPGRQRIVDVIAANPTVIMQEEQLGTRSPVDARRRRSEHPPPAVHQALAASDPTGTALFVAQTRTGDLR